MRIDNMAGYTYFVMRMVFMIMFSALGHCDDVGLSEILLKSLQLQLVTVNEGDRMQLVTDKSVCHTWTVKRDLLSIRKLIARNCKTNENTCEYLAPGYSVDVRPRHSVLMKNTTSYLDIGTYMCQGTRSISFNFRVKPNPKHDRNIHIKSRSNSIFLRCSIAPDSAVTWYVWNDKGQLKPFENGDSIAAINDTLLIGPGNVNGEFGNHYICVNAGHVVRYAVKLPMTSCPIDNDDNDDYDDDYGDDYNDLYSNTKHRTRNKRKNTSSPSHGYNTGLIAVICIVIIIVVLIIAGIFIYRKRG